MQSCRVAFLSYPCACACHYMPSYQAAMRLMLAAAQVQTAYAEVAILQQAPQHLALVQAEQQVANLQAQVAGLEAQVCTALTLCALGAPHCPCCCVCRLTSGNNAGMLGFWQTCVLRTQLEPLQGAAQQLEQAQGQVINLEAQVSTALMSCAPVVLLSLRLCMVAPSPQEKVPGC